MREAQASLMSSPALSNRRTTQRAPVPDSQDGLLRLWHNANVPVSEDKLRWWNAPVQCILATVKEQGAA